MLGRKLHDGTWPDHNDCAWARAAPRSLSSLTAYKLLYCFQGTFPNVQNLSSLSVVLGWIAGLLCRRSTGNGAFSGVMLPSFLFNPLSISKFCGFKGEGDFAGDVSILSAAEGVVIVVLLIACPFFFASWRSKAFWRFSSMRCLCTSVSPLETGAATWAGASSLAFGTAPLFELSSPTAASAAGLPLVEEPKNFCKPPPATGLAAILAFLLSGAIVNKRTGYEA